MPHHRQPIQNRPALKRSRAPIGRMAIVGFLLWLALFVAWGFILRDVAAHQPHLDANGTPTLVLH